MIESLTTSTVYATSVEENNWGNVVDLVVNIVKKAGRDAATDQPTESSANVAPGNMSGARARDRMPKPTSACFNARVSATRFFKSAPPAAPTATGPTFKEKARTELDDMKRLGASRSFGDPPLDALPLFWATEGVQKFPIMARAA